MKQGIFVTFEGPEGAGKSTQVRRLASQLEAQGAQVVTTREPGGTPVAETLRGLLKEHRSTGLGSRCELLLLLAARANHVDTVIRPALAAGKVVICDRFSDSSLAYQGGGRGVDADSIVLLDSFATDSLVPNLTFFLDLATETGMNRLKVEGRALDPIELQGAEFHQRVLEAYRELASRHPERITTISADRPEGEVADEIYNALWSAFPTLSLEA